MALYIIACDRVIRNAHDVKEAFRTYNCDGYPMPIYQAILDTINDIHGYDAEDKDTVYKLDPVGWSCAISETTIAEHNDYCDEVADFGELVEYMHANLNVFYADSYNEVVYYLV